MLSGADLVSELKDTHDVLMVLSDSIGAGTLSPNQCVKVLDSLVSDFADTLAGCGEEQKHDDIIGSPEAWDVEAASEYVGLVLQEEGDE